MNLSKQKIALLKVFYEKEVISFDDLPKYGTDSRSSLVRSLKIDRLIESANRVEGALPYYTAFKISDEGKAVYEAYLQELDHEKKELEEFELLKRQTIASEDAVEEAKIANEIAQRALDEAKSAKQESHISNIIAFLSFAVAFIALMISVFN